MASRSDTRGTGPSRAARRASARRGPGRFGWIAASLCAGALCACFADIEPPAVSPSASLDLGGADSAPDTPTPDLGDASQDVSGDASSIDLAPDLPPLPTEPLLVRVLDDFGGSLEVLREEPVGAAASLGDGTLLVVSAGRLLRLDERGSVLAEWEAAPPGVVDIASLEGGRALLLGRDGLSTFDGEGVAASPLNDSLTETPVRRLLATGSIDSPEVWLAADRALLRWRGGTLEAIEPSALPVTRARLAYGAPLGDRPALWVYAGGVLYALVEGDGGLRAHRERDDLVIRDLAVDGGGRLWALDEAGDVHQRGEDGSWLWFRLPAPVRALAAHRWADPVWLAGEGSLWFFERNLFTDVGSVLDPALRPDEGLRADALGRVYLTSRAPGVPGLVRLAADRPLLTTGLESGAQLVADDAHLVLYPARPELVDRVVATLRREGRPATPLDSAADGEAGPWRVTVRPTDHPAAVYELRIVVHYRDDFDPAEARILFTIGEVPVPTWSADVAPINEARCAECHAPEGNRTGHLRYTARGWQAEIDGILDSVRSGRMPLAPDPELSDDEIGVIEGWVAGGFRE